MRITGPKSKAYGVKFLFVAVFLAAIMMVGLAVSKPTNDAEPADQPTIEITTTSSSVLYAGKKCGFDSDCSHGKCRSGECGGCSFDSDCNGWGTCESNQCGGCSFDSECKGFGKCSSGKCTESPY